MKKNVFTRSRSCGKNSLSENAKNLLPLEGLGKIFCTGESAEG